jgi:hypothetical protein
MASLASRAGLRITNQSERTMNDTPRTDEWETYCDESYYHLWRVRRKNERGFNDGYHVHNGDEARALVDLLNKQDSEIENLKKYADKLAEGLPDNMIPKYVEVLCEANICLAIQLTSITKHRDGLAEAIVYALESMSDDDYGSTNVRGKARIVLKEAIAAVGGEIHE